MDDAQGSPCFYHPFYCEENAYHNCGVLAAGAAMLFIFGAGPWVSMLHQRAAPPGYVIRWDYHVVAVAPDGRIIDPDSRLGPEVDAAVYLTESFPEVGISEAESPRFRLVPWERAREGFGSDRRHMRNATGGWVQPPPPWPTINPGEHRLPQFIAKENNRWGPVLDLAAIRPRLAAGT
jgi:protein N-terminal glutamine amidohydrolase